jgi:hypothetical protein
VKRVTGIGGIFFKSEAPKGLYDWYEKHLGILRTPDGSGAVFEWREVEDSEKKGMTVWSVFPRDTKYFNPSLVVELRSTGQTRVLPLHFF